MGWLHYSPLSLLNLSCNRSITNFTREYILSPSSRRKYIFILLLYYLLPFLPSFLPSFRRFLHHEHPQSPSRKSYNPYSSILFVPFPLEDSSFGIVIGAEGRHEITDCGGARTRLGDARRGWMLGNNKDGPRATRSQCGAAAIRVMKVWLMMEPTRVISSTRRGATRRRIGSSFDKILSPVP